MAETASMRRTRAADAIRSWRPTRPADRFELIERIRRGLDFDTVAEAAEAAELSVSDLSHFGVIATRTLSHSRKTGQFTAAQSDRVARFFRVWQKTSETFGSVGKARRWLERPTRPLGGRAPASLLDTEEGARLVEELLFRIDHGLAA